ncbi:MAG TPA: thiamine pyrophosphate-dependent enzyme [Thermomicrobiaceae bacterium]|nr:thiamine pyrophosphate-dependent enzyme [Thermomicrobiaceae bacterium]
MKRIEALRVLAELTPELPVVVTLAATSRELAAVADRANHFYLLDSMGLAPSVATGLALALEGTPVARVVALEGDGSLLMNFGALATIGYLKPERLVLVVLDNGVYASTADIPTYTQSLDLAPIASAIGLTAWAAIDEPTLRTAMRQALAEPGPHFVHVRIEPGNTPGTPLLLADPVVLAARFEDWLNRALAGGSDS